MLSVRSFEGVISGKTQFSQWKKHKTVNTHRSFVQFRKSPQCKLSIEYKRVEVGGTVAMADLPDPTPDFCAQALLAYIIVTSFYKPSSINNHLKLAIDSWGTKFLPFFLVNLCDLWSPQIKLYNNRILVNVVVYFILFFGCVIAWKKSLWCLIGTPSHPLFATLI